MSNLGREPLQLVEIDIDACTLTYGTSPCTASGPAGSECFNTYKTCQDRENFDRGTQTLTFSKNQRTGIKFDIVFPALQSVSTNATQISLSRVDDKLGSLGKRARVTVRLKDFRWGDQVTDPYVGTRSYDPAQQGTFFGKLRARFPYYEGRALRVRNGYVFQPINEMSTRHYIITEVVGPDGDGNVSITAQDPLKLADDEFSQCPAPSNGRLSQAISSTFTGDVDLTPETVGDEYATEGRIAIGSEIMGFTRSGDTLTITERALDGSAAASHAQGDTVQECYRVDRARVEDVVQELLRDFAGVDPAFLPYAKWQTEITTWLASLRLTRTIPKPTPVRRLLGEIGDFGIVLWWNEIEQEVSIKVNRPPGLTETFTDVSDDTNILEKSLSRDDADDHRLSQVWLYHGVENYTASTDDPNNYSRLFAAVDLEAEGANEYDQSRLLELFSPWLGQSGDDGIASTVTKRMIIRYRDTPERVTFDIDVKDRNTVGIADLVRVQSKNLQDAFGASQPTEMQVVQSEETDPGHRLRVTLESYQFSGRFGFITENSRPDYTGSTDAQRAQGTYIVDETTMEFPDGTGPYKVF